MKTFFFLILLFTAQAVSFAQFTVSIHWYQDATEGRGDTIHYDTGRKLEWDDFKGRPDNRSMAAAITESGFGYRMAMQSVNGRTNVVITVFCYFNKKKSWVKENMDTRYALTHEQHHFDITYINTCRFVQKLKTAKLTAANFQSLVESIHDECYNALEAMQNEYDGQTSNGRIRNMQTVWNKKIDSLLASLVIN
jgi:hypothetical protein